MSDARYVHHDGETKAEYMVIRCDDVTNVAALHRLEPHSHVEGLAVAPGRLGRQVDKAVATLSRREPHG